MPRGERGWVKNLLGAKDVPNHDWPYSLHFLHDDGIGVVVHVEWRPLPDIG